MPAPADGWALHRAAWVDAYAVVLGCLAAGCLLWLSWYFLFLPLLLLRFRRLFVRAHSPSPGARLQITAQEQWVVLENGQRTRLMLQHAWPSPGWITLRFVQADANGCTHMRCYTVWRATVGVQAWRKLRLAVERSSLSFASRTRPEGA